MTTLGEAYVEIKPDTSKFASAAKKGLLVGGAIAGAALTAGLVGAFNADAMNAKLKAQLGLTANQSAKAGKVAGSLFGQNYGTGMEQINSAIKSVIQDIGGMRGASNKVLEDISKKALNTANIFDQDLGGVTRAVGQLMKTGLAKNASQAMDIVTAGFQKGADKSGDFLDTLNEYGTQFRKVGISGKTATGLLSQGLAGGARDADIVADAIKEFSIRSLESLSSLDSQGNVKLTALGQAFYTLGLDGDKMQENLAKGGPKSAAAMDTIMDKMRAIKDPVLKAQTATALFGTQAEDLGAALFKLDPSKAAKGLGQVKGAAERANKAFNDTPTAVLQGFIRQIQQGLVDVMANHVIPLIKQVVPAFQNFAAQMKSGEGAGGKFAAVLSAVGTAIKNTAGWLNAHRPVVVAVVAAYVAWRVAMIAFRVQQALSLVWLKLHTVGTVENTVVSKAAAAASKVWAAGIWLVNAAMKGNPIGLVIIAITALVAAVIIAYKNSDKFREIVDKAWSKIKQAVSDAWNNVIKPALAAFADFIVHKLIPFIKELWNNVIKPVFSAIGAAIKFTWNNLIQPVLRAWWAYVTHVLIPIIKFLWNNVVKPVFAFIGRAIKFTWNNIIQPVFKAWQAYLTKVVFPVIRFLYEHVVKPMFRAVGDVIQSVWNNAIKPTFSKLKEGVSAIAGAFKTAVNKIKGFWAGLKKAARDPIFYVVDTLYNHGIVPVVNKIPGVGSISEVHFADGGVLPGYTPGRDVHEFVSKTGGRLHLSGGEAIMRPEWVRQMGGPLAVNRMNKAARMGNYRKVGDVGAFKDGGTLDAQAASRAAAFAWSANGKPYVWGGVGPNGYDCSGFMSAITNVMRGKYPYSRVGSTASFPWPGFTSGPGTFTIGSANPYPGSSVGHMAGTINGLNVESSGGQGVHLGAGARGYNDPGFSTHAHIGGLAGSPFGAIIGDIKALWTKLHAGVEKLTHMGDWGTIMKGAVKSIAGALKDWINGKIPGPGPLPSFDRGGVARGRGSLLKNTIRPERVLTTRQNELFERMIEQLERPGPGGALVNIDTVNTYDVHAAARAISAEQRKALMIASLA